MLAKFPGVCAACGLAFRRGDDIKARYTYDRAAGDFVRWPGKWSHKTCPVVDRKTGEVSAIEILTTMGVWEPGDNAIPPERPESIRRKKPMRRAGVGQTEAFPETKVDKRIEHA
jgi:hypothetical protein